jgi:hypothetical protein
MVNIVVKYLLFIFDIISIIYSYEQIIIDNIFIHYCVTLFTIFLSIINISYLNSKKLNQELYLSDTKHIPIILTLLEFFCKVSFLFHSFPMQYTNLYHVSILTIHISTIIFLFLLGISIIYMICAYFKKLKIKIYPILSIQEFTYLNECSICLETNNYKIIKTNCNHEFHEECLIKWTKISKTCPICRKNLEISI